MMIGPGQGGDPVTGYTIWRMPEFKALCEKIGIAWQLPTRHLTIEIPCYPEDCVKITQHYLVGLPPPPDEAATIDTTAVHNKQFLTKTAPSREPLL